MASLTKRHQARNERALQDLIKSVPGNDRCADCQARNPGWASWSLGVFLCMRCAALHRKLGTHVSKVKSLSMDAWSAEQVDHMRQVGNAASNRALNPAHARPAVPVDADEVDGAMERFIRQKYVQRAFTADAPARAPAQRTGTAGTASSDDNPPPPPPKPGRKFAFGLRASSALPLSGARGGLAPASKKPEPPNKQSRVFGAAIGVREDGLEWKLVTLKEMGFADDRRNAHVLKGLGGDLERAIESLIKLGDGPAAGVGRTQPASRTASGANTPSAFDMPPQSREATSSQQPSVGDPLPRQVQSATQAAFPQPRPYNPFDVDPPSSAPAQQTSLENQFQQMQLNQPPPLFPNATGGHANFQDLMQHARLQQSMTPPPVPNMHPQYAFNNPYAQKPPSHNPFLQAVPQAQPSPSLQNNPYLAQQQAAPSPNPFLNQPSLNAVMSSPATAPLEQPPSLLQQNSWPLSSQPSPGMQSFTPPNPSPSLQPSPFHAPSQQLPPVQPQLPVFAPQAPFPLQPTYGSQPASPAQFQPQISPQYPQQQQPPVGPPRPGRIDKSSILALYNYPHLAPASPATTGSVGSSPSGPGTPSAPPGQPVGVTTTAAAASARQPHSQAQQAPQSQQQQQRSVTMPISGSKNPFLGAAATGGAAAAGGAAGRGVAAAAATAEEGSESGRHSPDAFASLSARFMR